jgi:hypothetical protein
VGAREERRLLVAVNWGAGRGRGLVPVQFSGLAGSRWLATELLWDPASRIARAELAERGLELDLPGWLPLVLAPSPAAR